jgi:hypothetical protein
MRLPGNSGAAATLRSDRRIILPFAGAALPRCYDEVESATNFADDNRRAARWKLFGFVMTSGLNYDKRQC